MAKAKTKKGKASDIELRPHVGIDRAGREITFAQDQIFVKGVRVGYIGHTPGTTCCMILPVGSKTLAEIYKAIEVKFGTAPSGTMTAPAIEERSDDE